MWSLMGVAAQVIGCSDVWTFALTLLLCALCSALQLCTALLPLPAQVGGRRGRAASMHDRAGRYLGTTHSPQCRWVDAGDVQHARPPPPSAHILTSVVLPLLTLPSIPPFVPVRPCSVPVCLLAVPVCPFSFPVRPLLCPSPVCFVAAPHPHTSSPLSGRHLRCLLHRPSVHLCYHRSAHRLPLRLSQLRPALRPQPPGGSVPHSPAGATHQVSSG